MVTENDIKGQNIIFSLLGLFSLTLCTVSSQKAVAILRALQEFSWGVGKDPV